MRNDAVGAQRGEPDDHDSHGERGDHDHHPGTEQRPQQDGGGDPPAGHAEHAREAAACKRRKHAAVADLATHLDGAHGVAANTGGKHLREEQALEVRGAQTAPAEQRARCRRRHGALAVRSSTPHSTTLAATASMVSPRAAAIQSGSAWARLATAWGRLIVRARMIRPTTVPLTRIHGDPITRAGGLHGLSHRHH